LGRFFILEAETPPVLTYVRAGAKSLRSRRGKRTFPSVQAGRTQRII